MQEIKEDGLIYSVIVRGEDVPKGTKWYGPESESMQGCSWLWGKDKLFKVHRHLYRPRQIPSTQEALVVIAGRLRCTVVKKTETESFTLNAGDMVIHYRGGHGYKVLDDDTKAYEFKSGPSPSTMPGQQDKEYI